MTTSGTTTFQLDFIEAIEEAYERCGLESRSGYDMKTARRSINLMQLEWANRGINLWTVEERTQVLTASDGSYQLNADIVDLLEHVISIADAPTETRYNVTRVSVSTFATRTNPELTGRPTQIYINRKNEGPLPARLRRRAGLLPVREEVHRQPAGHRAPEDALRGAVGQRS